MLNLFKKKVVYAEKPSIRLCIGKSLIRFGAGIASSVCIFKVVSDTLSRIPVVNKYVKTINIVSKIISIVGVWLIDDVLEVSLKDTKKVVLFPKKKK